MARHKQSHEQDREQPETPNQGPLQQLYHMVFGGGAAQGAVEGVKARRSRMEHQLERDVGKQSAASSSGERKMTSRQQRENDEKLKRQRKSLGYKD